MRKNRVRLSVMFLALGIGLAIIAGQAMADDDHDDDNRRRGFSGMKDRFRGAADVEPAADALYKKECGSCHFAYQPGLLPARSWEKLMAGLEDHFGDNAEIAKEDEAAITKYLTANSADHSGYKASVKITRSLEGLDYPIRITQTPYFVHEHGEIPRQAWDGNPQVKSLSHCDRCHTNAEAGSFNEHEVNIPGFGKWDD